MSQDTSSNNANSSSLSRTLQQSLQEVLMEVSMEGNRLLGPSPGSGPTAAPGARQAPPRLQNFNNLSFAAFNMPSYNMNGSSSGNINNNGVPSSSSSSVNGGRAVGAGMRPSEALGVSTEELLLAAATEQRMLEQTQRTMAARQQSLAEKTLESRRLYQESLLALMKGTNNNSNNNNVCNSMNNSFANMLGGGSNFGNGLLQQGFLSQFSKQPPVASMSNHHQLAASSQYAGLSLPKTSAAAAASVPPSLMGGNNGTKAAIKVLGTSLRKKDSPYLDISALQDPDVSDKRTRGGVTEPFPEKLHRMLEEVKKDGKDDIISFFSHGRAFAVHDPDRFISEVMPKYFKQSRLSSFQRQLNLYGFTRITSGSDAGGYYHELFLQGRPNLAVHMRRVGLPQGEDRRKMRAKNQRSEPNFYAMGDVKDAQVRLPGM